MLAPCRGLQRHRERTRASNSSLDSIALTILDVLLIEDWAARRQGNAFVSYGVVLEILLIARVADLQDECVYSYNCTRNRQHALEIHLTRHHTAWRPGAAIEIWPIR
jgi:hypothetical protein